MTEPVQEQIHENVQASRPPGPPAKLNRFPRAGGVRRGAGYAASKVPEVSVYFWITKVLTTGMGETTSDFLVTLARSADRRRARGGWWPSLALQFAVRRYSRGSTGLPS